MPASESVAQPFAGAVLGELLKSDSKRLEATLCLEPGTARIEVQCLLQSVLQVNRAYLLTHPERVLDTDEYARYNALFERRLNGVPIAYLLGVREFFGLDFKVTPATLIPRPDTELLVELALQRIPQQGAFRVLDMGTGSGAIALSIAYARPEAEVVAVDASEAALSVAGENAQRLNIANVRLLHSDWFSAIEGERFDLIVSNPPYIEVNDVHLLQGDVRFEPLSALASGADGLDDIRRISNEAKTHLASGGWLMFEHGYDQAVRVRQLLQQIGFFDVESLRDLSGIERVTLGRA
ncbi:MAG: peptide chain release factor N(5)-glutamine methyltransferase [Gallionella sp.]|jgi:release factor glutamine methyltransferase